MSAANREFFFLQPLNFATFFQEKVEDPAAGDSNHLSKLF